MPHNRLDSVPFEGCREDAHCLPTGAADQIAGPSLDWTERGGIIPHAGLRDRALITLMVYSFAHRRLGSDVGPRMFSVVRGARLQ